MSAPATNASSRAPRITITRTESSSSSASAAGGIARHISLLIALRRSGWSKTIHPMECSRTTWTAPDILRALYLVRKIVSIRLDLSRSEVDTSARGQSDARHRHAAEEARRRRSTYAGARSRRGAGQDARLRYLRLGPACTEARREARRRGKTLGRSLRDGSLPRHRHGARVLRGDRRSRPGRHEELQDWHARVLHARAAAP